MTAFVSHRHRRRALATCAVICALAFAPAQAQEVGAATYVRTDSDDTLVVAPRLRLRAPFSEATSLSVVYAVDVWTSASIDIVTSASPQPVTEQRDEIDVSLDHEFTDVTVTAAYRFSTEPDYESHGVSGGFGYDFNDNNSTLAVGFSGSLDSVGRAGDPEFDRGVTTVGGRVAFTQVLDVDSLAQVLYEISRAEGYLGSPYRFVPIGSGYCTRPAPEPVFVDPMLPVPEPQPVAPEEGVAVLCVPEVNPGDRMRHAFGVVARRSLGDDLSAQLGYRFYLDSWGIVSHTARAEVSYLPDPDTILSVRYRFYTQGAADHYKSTYDQVQQFVTTDKELSPLSSHRIGFELERVFRFDGDRELSTTLSFAPLFYSYSDFRPLDSITAFEFNAALGFKL